MSAPALLRRLLAIAGGGIAAGGLLIPAPLGAAQDGSVTVPPRAESWYRPLPAGASGALAPPPVPPPSPYPAGTLHVGVSGGVEESRTYLVLDLADVPTEQELTGGTLTLPIASGPAAGTALPDMAKVRACHEPTFVRDGVEGEVTGAPEPDCTISSPATFTVATDDQPAALVVDLTPFVGLWSGGVAGLALLPEEGLAPSEQWHVAFHRRDSNAADAVPISARLELSTVDELDERPAASLADDFTPPPASTSFAAPPLDVDSFEAPVLDPPTVDIADDAQRATAQPVVSVVGVGFAYPAVFLLPLVAAGAIAWAGRAFTRDLQAGR